MSTCTVHTIIRTHERNHTYLLTHLSIHVHTQRWVHTHTVHRSPHTHIHSLHACTCLHTHTHIEITQEHRENNTIAVVLIFLI